MNENFKLFKLGELAEIIAGGDKPKIFTERKSNINCIPVVANGENKDGLLGYTDLPKIVEAAVTISARGSKVGFAAIRKQPFFPIVRLLTLIPIKERLYVDFLYYKLKQNRQGGTGSGQPQITIPDISNKSISIPSLPTQKKIAAVLSALDAKIELNNQINTELEAMSKKLYDYWFVQFDFPDENGKPYKSSDGKMVFNETLKREIPVGWEVKNIFEVAKVQYGFPFSTKFFNTDNVGAPVIRIRDILENSISNYSNEPDVDEKYLIKKGDLLVGMDGNFHINYWTKDDCYLNQRVVMIKEKNIPNMIIKYQIEPYIKLREKSVSRTTVGHLSDKDLKRLEILIPSKQLSDKSKNLFDSFLEKIIINQRQNQELAQLRDWLLPMLMNGQVRVGECDEEDLGLVAEERGEYINR